jgi:Calpain family cysteine protease
MDFDFGMDGTAGGPPAPQKPKGKSPQASILSFWSKFLEKNPSRVNAIFPPSLYEDLLPRISSTTGSQQSRNTAESYDKAVRECKDRVAKIVRECHRTNEKFVDADFDLEDDFGCWNCLDGLLTENDSPSGGIDASDLAQALDVVIGSQILGNVDTAPLDLNALRQVLRNSSGPPTQARPGSVHRVDWIYDDPKFTIDGYGSSDILQGSNGDCWWLAAVATLCSVEGVMQKICVAKDEECGVYGFVFFRDGAWIYTVIDDNLYLDRGDFTGGYDPRGENSRKYKERHQTGSEALYFASCSDQNETWLPLLEKAYAKVHGDYAAISGGLAGEAIEDMTGGVTTIILSNKILSKNRLWKEMLNENKDFLFAVSSKQQRYAYEDQKTGLALQHAYSVLRATEENDEKGKSVRLVKIRYVQFSILGLDTGGLMRL